jgi:four helix bundle suffix protein
VQNIAEGSQASGTSRKFEIKLTSVARASLEELKLDYEDFLRHRGLKHWERNHPLRQLLVDQRCSTAEEVAEWIRAVHGHSGRNGLGGQSSTSTTSTKSTYPELAANTALTLIAVACSLLDRQLAAQSDAFENEGGFTERLHRVRSRKRFNRS